MSKSTGASKRVETWTVQNPIRMNGNTSTDRVQIVKIAIRYPDGRFHGATNFPNKD